MKSSTSGFFCFVMAAGAEVVLRGQSVLIVRLVRAFSTTIFIDMCRLIKVQK